MRVYLKKEIREHKEFKTKVLDVSRNYLEHWMFGRRLSLDEERLYLDIGDKVLGEFPMEFAEFVDRATAFVYIPLYPHREYGVYKHLKAEAEVDRYNNDADAVRIVADNVEDLLELCHQIRVGSIHPEESYEGVQGGASYETLATMYPQLQEQLENERKENRTLVSQLNALRSLRNKLSQGWPFCRKETVVKDIGEILSMPFEK